MVVPNKSRSKKRTEAEDLYERSQRSHTGCGTHSGPGSFRQMRSLPKVLALSVLVSAQGCATIEFLGGNCPQDQLVVTWPATLTRGSSVTNRLLTFTLTPTNVDKAQFELLRQALTGTPTVTYNVTWTVPAFDVNGGYIAFRHTAPMVNGETQQVEVAFAGGGWGATSTQQPLRPAISLRADNFEAAAATGSITAIGTAPLRLRIDVTTTNAPGETIRVSGNAGFVYQRVDALCTSL